MLASRVLAASTQAEFLGEATHDLIGIASVKKQMMLKYGNFKRFHDVVGYFRDILYSK